MAAWLVATDVSVDRLLLIGAAHPVTTRSIVKSSRVRPLFSDPRRCTGLPVADRGIGGPIGMAPSAFHSKHPRLRHRDLNRDLTAGRLEQMGPVEVGLVTRRKHPELVDADALLRQGPSRNAHVRRPAGSMTSPDPSPASSKAVIALAVTVQGAGSWSS
ncbi:hypothetical protein HBB16_01500 [Pseudonocardia sp. MCCB 268]|nr:hypothetical protein [Pseudonocardia cytotoxica]